MRNYFLSEKVAFRCGWIDKEQPMASTEKYGESPCGARLKSVTAGKYIITKKKILWKNLETDTQY